ncbi:MAG: hypothetical protein ABH890_06495 [Bacillota bacterium]
MKKKELLKFIKTKSQEVQIKDLSQMILEKARLLPVPEVIIQPKKRFFLKPSLVYSFSLMTAVLAFFIIYSPATPVTPQIEDVNQVMALSAVSAVSLVEYSDEGLSQNDSVSLSVGYFTLDVTPEPPQIDTEIDDVSMYLQMMERLLNSADDFDYQFDTTDPNGYAHHLTFKTMDLLNQETNYVFNFNKEENISANMYSVNGILEIGNDTYTVSGEGELNNPQNFQFRVQKDDSNFIDISYQITNTGNRYNISVTKSGVNTQKVNLTVRQENNKKAVYLDFVEGTSTGSYAFQIDEINQMKRMRINYYIAGSSDESGEIDVIVDTSGTDAQYAITVRPQGQEPYVIERGRGTTGNNGGHGQGMSSTTI